MTDHAHELRRHAKKIAHPAGDVPAVMRAAADEIDRLQSVIAGQYTMSRDEIIEAALQCGVWIPMGQGQEREQTIDRLQRLWGRAVAAEHEACAALCDRFALRDMHPAECAAAIRARGDA